MTPVRLEPAALRSRVKHSTTEPLRSLWDLYFIYFYWPLKTCFTVSRPRQWTECADQIVQLCRLICFVVVQKWLKQVLIWRGSNIFLHISFNICFGCSKQPSDWDGSFEFPQLMFWWRYEKNLFCYTVLTKGQYKIFQLLKCWVSLNALNSETPTFWIQVRSDILLTWPGSKLCIKVISRWQILQHA